MNFAKKHWSWLAIAVPMLLLLTGSVGLAQLPGAGGAGTLGTDFATLSKLFGEHTAFTTKSDVRIYDKDQKETTSFVMNFVRLDNKYRVEIDISQMKNKDMPAAAIAAMKQLNMDKVVTIVRPEKKVQYLIFPGIQSYVNTPLTKDEADAFVKNPKIDKAATGKETLDGHACVKHKIVATDDKKAKTEFTVWNATDLKDFPVQIMTQEKDATVIIRYKEIQLAKPDTKQFDVPADFKAYPDYLALAQAATMKMMNEPAAPPPKK